MKKILIFGIFFLLLFFPLKSSFAQTEITGEHIRSYDVDIEINKDATINVIEKIDYDFSILQKHGIYRKIPYIKPNKNNKKYKMTLSDFSVLDENNKAYSYTQSDDGTNIQLKIGNANFLITGLHTYIISYKVSGALTYLSDHDELYWNVTGDQWNVPIVHSSVVVTLPKEILEKDIKTICFAGAMGVDSSTCHIANKDNQTTVQTTKVLSPQEGLTFAVSFPMDIVAHLEAKEVVNFQDTLFGKIFFLILGLAVLFWYVGYPIKIIYKWWRYGRDPKGMVGETRAWFDPPKLKNGQPMTPTEVGSLIDEKVDLRDISAAIVDLARRGYLKIEERKKNDFYFVQKKTDLSGLQPFEKKLLDGIFETEKEVRIKDKKLAATVLKATDLVYTQLVTEQLFPKNPNATRIFYSVIGVLAFMTGNLGLALVAFTFGRFMPAKTIFGVECANISKSLKNFLATQERQLEFQAKNQMMFEKLLPFAVAFGVERIWAQRFKDIALKSPEWYSGYDSTRAFNSVLLASSLSSSMSSFRTSATPVSSTTGHSSGFGGGGFSGGGGGGGGGGSW